MSDQPSGRERAGAILQRIETALRVTLHQRYGWVDPFTAVPFSRVDLKAVMALDPLVHRDAQWVRSTRPFERALRTLPPALRPLFAHTAEHQVELGSFISNAYAFAGALDAIAEIYEVQTSFEDHAMPFGGGSNTNIADDLLFTARNSYESSKLSVANLLLPGSELRKQVLHAGQGVLAYCNRISLEMTAAAQDAELQHFGVRALPDAVFEVVLSDLPEMSPLLEVLNIGALARRSSQAEGMHYAKSVVARYWLEVIQAAEIAGVELQTVLDFDGDRETNPDLQSLWPELKAALERFAPFDHRRVGHTSQQSADHVADNVTAMSGLGRPEQVVGLGRPGPAAGLAPRTSPSGLLF